MSARADQRAAVVAPRGFDAPRSYLFVSAREPLAAAVALWMLVFEKSPWPTLTLIVSLEAIFLSTFVMISQNRADAKRQVIADEQWQMVQEEDKQNVELIKLSNQILELTHEVRKVVSALEKPSD